MDTTFDTLSAADDLQEAGFSPTQARVLSHTMARSQGNLATKDDIAVLRAEISSLRTVIFSVVFPIMLANLGITVTLLILLLRG